MPKNELGTPAPARLPLVDALRAVLATTIAWHHFVLYGPLAQYAEPLAGRSFDWLRNYRWAVQAFFVVGGYVLARSMARRRWNLRQAGWFVVRRYLRLGLPYLVTIAAAVAACAVGRGWLPDAVVGAPPTGPQILAHALFLQDILGYPALSAGLWFVCIDFQLGLIYVALLVLRDSLASPGRAVDEGLTTAPLLVGWSVAAASLFYFNLHERYDAWGVYYFAHFFLGTLVYHGLASTGGLRVLGLFALVMSAALAYSWRWRLAAAMVTGLFLFLGDKLGLLTSWPRSRLVAYLGRTSYSLFLIHFPVLVVVETAWARLGRTSPWDAVAGLCVAYVASLVAAALLYAAVEAPAATLSRRFS